MTLVMEATKSIISQGPISGAKVQDEFIGEREPFEHEQLQSIDNLYVKKPHDTVGKENLFALASEVGLLDVLRWKPRLVRAP